MPTVLHAPDEETLETVIEHRRRNGLARFDEVWNGEYVLMNAPSNPHQRLAGELAAALRAFLDRRRGDVVYPGINITDQDDRADWKANYRIPDVAVFLADNPAEDRGSHYFGGPDLAIEIVSPNDRTYDKFEFYASVGTKELLVVDETFERIERFVLHDGEFDAASVLTIDSPAMRTSCLDAIWTMERIRRCLAEHHPSLTLWAGVACYPAHAFDVGAIIDRADVALTAAQDWHQDRIEVATAE